ncbi:hypothetical protein [Salinibacillus xinjiangensis]|uniref:Uncharacterized protein n=1 Tax=Salinibacillus xinjiangensis TaxID=1229268 RepID=A0A6G1X3N4_9BACI|nr:hypothetical protein [Salinibacillus xinjiangensis]MRG85601.1 hypothetical protein [Salinibacillus xinjiangensis]
MANVYILLTKTGSVFSQTIGLYTGAPYNHVSISLNKELTELYSFGRKKPYNPVRAGFVKECVHNGVYARFPNTTCEIYSLQVSERQKDKMQRVIQHFKKNDRNYRYNLLGIATVPFGKSLDRRHAYFCSQFVATVLKIAGIEVWEKPLGLITPDEYRKTSQLDKIYEGPLHQYFDTLHENQQHLSIPNQMFQI